MRVLDRSHLAGIQGYRSGTSKVKLPARYFLENAPALTLILSTRDESLLRASVGGSIVGVYSLSFSAWYPGLLKSESFDKAQLSEPQGSWGPCEGSGTAGRDERRVRWSRDESSTLFTPAEVGGPQTPVAAGGSITT